jgi:hypothetical protein
LEEYGLPELVLEPTKKRTLGQFSAQCQKTELLYKKKAPQKQLRQSSHICSVY